MNFAWNARLPRSIQESFTCCKSTTWDWRLYFPSEGRRAEDFLTLKNPTASAGFEPANLGTKGQHTTSRPPKPLMPPDLQNTNVRLRWIIPLVLITYTESTKYILDILHWKTLIACWHCRNIVCCYQIQWLIHFVSSFVISSIHTTKHCKRDLVPLNTLRILYSYLMLFRPCIIV